MIWLYHDIFLTSLFKVSCVYRWRWGTGNVCWIRKWLWVIWTQESRAGIKSMISLYSFSPQFMFYCCWWLPTSSLHPEGSLLSITDRPWIWLYNTDTIRFVEQTNWRHLWTQISRGEGPRLRRTTTLHSLLLWGTGPAIQWGLVAGLRKPRNRVPSLDDRG